MGCKSSRQTISSRKLRNGTFERTVVDIDSNIDWDKECNRAVKEFPMYADRLKEIDWRAAIESNVDWTDPNFTHDIESLLDPTIRLVGEKSVE